MLQAPQLRGRKVYQMATNKQTPAAGHQAARNARNARRPSPVAVQTPAPAPALAQAPAPAPALAQAPAPAAGGALAAMAAQLQAPAPAPVAPAPAPVQAVALRGGLAIVAVRATTALYRTSAPHNVAWWALVQQQLAAGGGVATVPALLAAGVPAPFVGYVVRRGYLAATAPTAPTATA